MLLNDVRISECKTYEQKKDVWELFFRMFPEGSHGIKNVTEYIEKVSKYAQVIVACKDDQLIGFIAFYANDFKTQTAYVTQFLVDQKYRNQGVGKKLLSECEVECKKKEFLCLRLEVGKDNENASSFYEHCGFIRDTATDKSIYMEKKL